MPDIMQTSIKSLPLVYRGKVRECYAVGEDKLLMIATDRISAFDVILSAPIPKKGKVLTALTNFWFDKLAEGMPTQLTGVDPETVVAEDEREQVRGRAMVVKRLKPILIECVARGYIIGGGWKDYQATGSVCGIKLPAGLKQAEKLPEPIATQIRDLTLSLYKKAADYAATRGIIIADTKFEFGLDENGRVCLMDEVLTPDSSRFWPAESYELGISPPSYDKQFIRDWLETQPWDKTPPAPVPPAEIIEKTAAKYREALVKLAGKDVE